MVVLGQPTGQPLEGDLSVAELRSGVRCCDDDTSGNVLQADGRVGAVPVLPARSRCLVNGDLDLGLELLEVGHARRDGFVFAHCLTSISVPLEEVMGQPGLGAWALGNRGIGH